MSLNRSSLKNWFKASTGITLLIVIAVFRLRAYCDAKLVTCLEKDHILTPPPVLSRIDPFLERARTYTTELAWKYFPSPHSELLLGMVVGLDYFGKLPFFKAQLVETGTIHVVVVSGFNISLVYSLVWKGLGSFYDRKKLIIGMVVALMYAGLSGFEPPVVRSWVMGTLAYLGKHYGRSFPALKLVFVSALAMIIWQPAYLFSLSFQLSLSATLSLMLFTDLVSSFLGGARFVPSIFREDFITTIAAQVLVWPILSYYFGRVSMAGILVNTLVLWTVPIGTILGGIFLMFGLIAGLVGEGVMRMVAFVVYIPLDLFVTVIQISSGMSSSWGISELEWQIPAEILGIYYLTLFLFLSWQHFRKGFRKRLEQEGFCDAAFGSEQAPQI